jgi:phosphoserine aminotransferase
MASKLICDFRKAMKVPKNFHILLQQGGATQQYSAVPQNLALGGRKQASANYLITG